MNSPRMRRVCLLLAAALLTAAVAFAQPTPPVAKIIPKVDTSFGDIRTDNYYWLREKTSPDVISYLEAENAYTDSVMKHTDPLQKKLYDEMLGRIKETDLTVPVKHDDYYYYSRTEEGKPYSIYCRKYKSLDSAEQVILDVNELAKGHDYLAVGVLDVSPNHQMLAYAYDTAGSERLALRFKDLKTGVVLPEVIGNTTYETSWSTDNKTLFYVTLDDAARAYKLWRHTLGEDPAKDVLVYHEPDSAFSVGITLSKDKAFLLMRLTSLVSSEVRYVAADKPAGEFRTIEPRRPQVEYEVEHIDKRFIIRTNDNALNFRLVEAPEKNPSRNSWKDILPHRDSVLVEGMDLFKEYLVVFERRNGLPQLRVSRWKDGNLHYVQFDEPVYNFYPMGNPDFNSHIVRYNYTSLVTPSSVYDYDMTARTRELKKQQEVLGGYDPTQYQSERLFAPAPDGKLVPISLVYKKGLERDGNNPMLLYGYGAYGISSDPNFSSNRLSLFDRGFIYAIAHVRGGSELGRQWYEDGKLLHKKNGFTDFIACADYLISQKYTSEEKLAISGGSAGGLLMGAVTVMRPDLFAVVVADVPFVDVINTMLDESLPLTVEEFEEWGNPKVEEYYRYMRSYSPYDNTVPKVYPALLATGGLNDPRVSYWEPSKWVARLRSVKTDSNRLLLKINMEAGHGGLSGRYGRLKEIAFEYAFIFDILGIRR
ncbi:MAG: S9 family peptidase [Candidatus Zixiibacteriota bacterium]